MCLDLFSHAFREGDRCVEDRAGKQQHEFFTTVPAGPVDLAHLVAQNPRELLQHRVAGLVTVRVIHTLETIEIAHDARKGLAQSTGVLEHLSQPLLEMSSIVEPREAIRL